MDPDGLAAQAPKAGIEVVYQDLALCDNLTAAANVFLGRELGDCEKNELEALVA